MKIEVNCFCKEGLVTKEVAQRIYEEVKNLKNETIELDFSNVKIVYLQFFKEFLSYYYPKTENIQIKNLKKIYEALLREALRCLRAGSL